MIQFFSNFSKGWGAKIILGMLAISMAVVWGLGGFLNTSISGSNTALKVGSEKVSMPELVNEFNVEKQRLSMMAGGANFSNAKAIEAGLLDQVVQKMVMERVQDSISEKLGLSASNNSVRKYVERNPVFADALGNFDKNMFYAYLSQTRMSEAQLAKKLEKELAFQHLTNTVRELGYAPALLADLAYRFQNEKRTIEYVVIKPTDIKISEKPTEEELHAYYDAYADELMVPEFRTLSVIVLTPEMMLDRVVVDEDELNEQFAERRAAAVVPEKRDLLQIRTDTREQAAAIMKTLSAPKGKMADYFVAVAGNQADQTPDQTAFGLTPKTGMLDELSDPVFAAKKGALVGPIESPLGWHIFYVRDIVAASVPSDAKIRAEIKKQLAGEKTYDTMYETARRLEDILGAGDSLEWAAGELNLPIQKIAATNVRGQDAAGKDLPDNLKNVMLLQEAFALKQGGVTALIEHNSGYLVAKVDSISPMHQKDFKDAGADLNRIWKQKRQEDKFADISKTVLERVQAGAELKKLGTFGDFKVQTASDITRGKIGDVPPSAVESIFAQNAGNKVAALTPAAEGNVISIVKKITPANPDKDEVGLGVVAQNMTGMVGETLAQNVISAYANQISIHVDRLNIEKTFRGFVQGEE